MKKMSISLFAIVAAIFAISSAFTTNSDNKSNALSSFKIFSTTNVDIDNIDIPGDAEDYDEIIAGNETLVWAAGTSPTDLSDFLANQTTTYSGGFQGSFEEVGCDNNPTTDIVCLALVDDTELDDEVVIDVLPGEFQDLTN